MKTQQIKNFDQFMNEAKIEKSDKEFQKVKIKHDWIEENDGKLLTGILKKKLTINGNGQFKTDANWSRVGGVGHKIQFTAKKSMYGNMADTPVITIEIGGPEESKYSKDEGTFDSLTQLMNFIDIQTNEAKQTHINESKYSGIVIISIDSLGLTSERNAVRDYLKENEIIFSEPNKFNGIIEINKDSLKKSGISLEDIKQKFKKVRVVKPILTLDEIVKKIGDNTSVRQVVHFCWDNYTAVTGLPESDRDKEMEFPDEILDIIKHYDFDYDRFADIYGQVAGN
jgi:hypothetical protein